MKRSIFITSLNRTTTRSGLSIILLFITMLVILFYLAQNYRTNLIDFRKMELKRQVEISLNTIDPILENVRNGSLSREEAVNEAASLVRRMTYTSETMNNYIFMSSYDGIMLVQPLEPWLQDTYQMDLKDSYGKYLIHDLIKTAQSPSGEGFVSYYYPPPGSDNPGEKLSYVKGIPELDCYVGTGMFFNDINELFREYLFGPMIIIIIVFTSIYILIIMYMRPLIRCFQFLLNTFQKISLNPDTVPKIPLVSFPQDSDEREILTGFENMIEKVQQSRIELINSEKRYRYLYEESMGVRIIVDRSGLVSGANKSFLRALGFNTEEFDGRNLFDIFNSGQEEDLEEMVNRAFDGTYTHAWDFDLVDSEGRLRTILFSDSRILPEDDNKVLITGVDITNRKIAERSAAIQKEQLLQADKLASLGVLVSGVAHEINNPNQFILSNAGLLEDVWADVIPVLEEYYNDNGDFLIKGSNYSEMRKLVPEYLGGMTEGARRIGKIVSDLKSLSRDDSHHPWSDVDVNSILESAVNLCSNMIKKATDNFLIQLDDNIPPTYGNSQKLEQVFINLIQNAVQSLNDSSAEISIKTSCAANGGIEVIISDHGRGIEPENLKRLFDPFFTTKRESGGTGIGLSISKSIIDEHRGSLKYSSSVGKGTIAAVYLPDAAGQPKEMN
ncbi:MAG: cache domain-containing protein [Spirochaetales bacterium]|nr:cache domain-containing protein [Spirochaetales bacterium]